MRRGRPALAGVALVAGNAVHYERGQRYGHLNGYDCELEATTVEELEAQPTN